MRTKRDILESTRLNALKSDIPDDIALIHSLHTLEVLIDIRDILAEFHETQRYFLNIMSEKD